MSEFDVLLEIDAMMANFSRKEQEAYTAGFNGLSFHYKDEGEQNAYQAGREAAIKYGEGNITL